MPENKKRLSWRGAGTPASSPVHAHVPPLWLGAATMLPAARPDARPRGADQPKSRLDRTNSRRGALTRPAAPAGPARLSATDACRLGSGCSLYPIRHTAAPQEHSTQAHQYSAKPHACSDDRRKRISRGGKQVPSTLGLPVSGLIALASVDRVTLRAASRAPFVAGSALALSSDGHLALHLHAGVTHDGTVLCPDQESRSYKVYRGT